jgi:hypothetical protein
MEPALREELQTVSRLAKTSMNQLIIQAIRAQLPEIRSRLELELEQTLEQLRTYSERDRNFTIAIEAFATSEATHDDPLEGEVLPSETDLSQAQRRFRALLEDT